MHRTPASDREVPLFYNMPRFMTYSKVQYLNTTYI